MRTEKTQKGFSLNDDKLVQTSQDVEHSGFTALSKV